MQTKAAGKIKGREVREATGGRAGVGAACLHDGAVGDAGRRPAVPAVRQRAAQPAHVERGDERPHVAAGGALGPRRRAGGVAEPPPPLYGLVGQCLRVLDSPPGAADEWQAGSSCGLLAVRVCMRKRLDLICVSCNDSLRSV